MGSLSPKNGRQRGGFLAVFNEWEGVASLLVDRIVVEGQDTNFNTGNCNYMPGEKIFNVSGVKHWSRLPRETVGSPSLEIFKAQLEHGPQRPDAVDPALSRGWAG